MFIQTKKGILNMKYMIKDWASNVLQYNGKFNFSAYGANNGAPMEFEDFESAWEWLYYRHPNKECFDDYFVEEIKT